MTYPFLCVILAGPPVEASGSGDKLKKVSSSGQDPKKKSEKGGTRIPGPIPGLIRSTPRGGGSGGVRGRGTPSVRGALSVRGAPSVRAGVAGSSASGAGPRVGVGAVTVPPVPRARGRGRGRGFSPSEVYAPGLVPYPEGSDALVPEGRARFSIKVYGEEGKGTRSEFRCRLCKDFYCYDRRRATSHEDNHFQPTCPYCGKKMRKDNLKAHIANVHKKQG